MDTLTAMRLGLLDNQLRAAWSRRHRGFLLTYPERNLSNSLSVNSARLYANPKLRLNSRNVCSSPEMAVKEDIHCGTGSPTPRRRLDRDADIDRCGRRTTMSQDLADDFEVGTGVNLPARMAVSKGMCSDHIRRNTGLRRVVPDAMANHTAGHRLVGHVHSEKQMTR